MDLDHFPVDQRHVLDEQTQNSFSLAVFDGRIIPDTWKSSRQRKQLLRCLSIDQQSLLLRLLLILSLRVGQGAKLVIPFRFQAIGDKAIVGINLHVAAASEFSIVLCSLNLLPPQPIGFCHPCFNFLLDGESNL